MKRSVQRHLPQPITTASAGSLGDEAPWVDRRTFNVPLPEQDALPGDHLVADIAGHSLDDPDVRRFAEHHLVGHVLAVRL